VIVHLRVREIALLFAQRDEQLELRLPLFGHDGRAALDAGELAFVGVFNFGLATNPNWLGRFNGRCDFGGNRSGLCDRGLCSRRLCGGRFI
jgi:hypothetical protein